MIGTLNPELFRLTEQEKRELGEILAGFGLFGSRFHATHYSSRATKPGNTSPERKPAMTPHNKMQLHDADFKVLTFAHYPKDAPVSIDCSQYGLTRDEKVAILEYPNLVQEYAATVDDQRRQGTTFRDYVQVGFSDECNAPMPGDLERACTKLQAHFGTVADPKTANRW